MNARAQREKSLANLLAALFDADGLRRWVRYELGVDVYNELPGPAACFDKLVFETVLAMQRHRCVTDAAFRSLRDARPAHAHEICHVAALWALSIDAEPAAAAIG